IEPDPLQVVHRFSHPRDQEIAGLIAAAFAYGRASIVVANAGTVLARMKPSPYEYLVKFDRGEAMARFAGFAHRFQKTRELVDLLEKMAYVIRDHGSLGEAFRACYDENDGDIGPALTRFVAMIVAEPRPSPGASRHPLPRERECTVSTKALEYLLPSPARGSACKRMNLFLRWMVRRTSPDLGIWTFVDPAKLLMPVDTHIHRIATFLGLNSRKSADWKAARQITDALARFDPADPVRYDFALCRLGILDLCSRKRRKENCDVCLLRDACRFPVVKSKPLDKPRPRIAGAQRAKRL
ncbi:MAG TPA: TIGR02757 family protein, partial [Thermoanaerobaculia bacterium]|nr:TIGR02757 family protein [Thermoanaerobaculia bacterium]